jgi:hypothetical protein
LQSASSPERNYSCWGGAPALLLDKRLAPWFLRLSASLEQVILLDAWRMNLWSSGCSWTSDFTITDLVLGTQSNLGHGARDMKPDEGYKRMKNHSADCHDLIERNELNQSLQRLRIEHIDFYEDLIAGIFAGLFCGKLRIIMLYPWVRDFRQQADKIYHTSLNDFLEGRIAKRILSLIFPELRLLVIGAFKFYISPETQGSHQHGFQFSDGPPNLTIRCLDKLLSNPVQAAEIHLSLDERDWVFINDLPPHPMQQDGWAMRRARCPESDAVGEEANFLPFLAEMPLTTKYRNYMVLHRQTRTTQDQPRPPSSCLVYGKPLGNVHNVASWNLNSNVIRAREGIERTYPAERVSRKKSIKSRRSAFQP